MTRPRRSRAICGRGCRWPTRPQDLADFGKYAAEVVRRYRQEQPHAVTHYQILNEPIYTNYALPRQFGYTLADYLRLLEAGSRAMKAADPQLPRRGRHQCQPRART